MTHPDTLAAASQSETFKANLRHDARRRDIVNHGLAMQQSANTICAVEYLKAQGIAAAVIERVLLDPQRRRHFTGH